ncbi:hypothetical protein JDV02_003123 [Purpureocillium takamizusanense]|uniref:Uncharacterized protein n=1 Tax=Purpureocillium takamizusanense TaxID=2060973 RepID=A0A9Q8QD09_9HYPO|nr:uncharacterized protein JDV02_003123 [Purpureocillium takamizusanense]UNI16709.1 hypothetical protein JDV02_003123 [Purpureocillium takamizusanense]
MSNKQLPLPPRFAPEIQCYEARQIAVHKDPQTIEIQALHREVGSLKAEVALLVDRIRSLTDENQRLVEGYVQSDHLRQDIQGYQEALKNIMRYTLVTVSECRAKAKERQVQPEAGKAVPTGDKTCSISWDSGTVHLAEASALI